MKYVELVKMCRQLSNMGFEMTDDNGDTIAIPKIKTVAIKHEPLLKAFADFMETAAENNCTLPDNAVDYYNAQFADDIVTEDDDEAKWADEDPANFVESSVEFTPPKEDSLIPAIDDIEKFKAESRQKAQRQGNGCPTRKPRKPKMDGVVAVACKLIKDDPQITSPEILDILELKFPERSRKGMYSTVGHVISIVRVYQQLD